jgi:hypothetical protein
MLDIVTCMSDYRRGLGLLRFIDHLQVVTTTNYNTTAISTLCSSVQHTVYCSQSVTRCFLVTALTGLCLRLKSSLYRHPYRIDYQLKVKVTL